MFTFCDPVEVTICISARLIWIALSTPLLPVRMICPSAVTTPPGDAPEESSGIGFKTPLGELWIPMASVIKSIKSFTVLVLVI